jgi:hypothetical protein
VARAKQTGRAEARRRYRQTAASQESGEEGAEGGAELDYGERRPDTRSKATAQPARSADKTPTGRVGFMDSFRLAYHPVHLRDDLRALPEILVSRAFIAAAALLLIGGIAWLLFPVRSGSALLWQLLVLPGSALAPQLVGGFFAPRASYLIGLALGVIQTIVFVLVSNSPPVIAAYQALEPDSVPAMHLDQIFGALISSAFQGALFASAAAWYRRFLSLSSARRPQPSRGGGGRRASGR